MRYEDHDKIVPAHDPSDAEFTLECLDCARIESCFPDIMLLETTFIFADDDAAELDEECPQDPIVEDPCAGCDFRMANTNGEPRCFVEELTQWVEKTWL